MFCFNYYIPKVQKLCPSQSSKWQQERKIRIPWETTLDGRLKAFLRGRRLLWSRGQSPDVRGQHQIRESKYFPSLRRHKGKQINKQTIKYTFLQFPISMKLQLCLSQGLQRADNCLMCVSIVPLPCFTFFEGIASMHTRPNVQCRKETCLLPASIPEHFLIYIHKN